MALPPQKFREIVVQLLYSQDFAPIDPVESIPFMMNELKVTKRTMIEVHDRLDKISEKLGEIDAKITETSTEYTFDRISKVERTIIRLGLYELFFDPSIPDRVVFAEAIRLCRKFGSPESANFVNAILDSIYKKGALNNEPANQPVSL
jgi:N utilization substance protein B